MKKGFGIISFIFGTVLGGIFTVFTAKRKGVDVRKDFYAAVKNKENLSDLLISELKGLASEAKQIASEAKKSDLVDEYKEIATKKFDNLYVQAQKKMSEMKSSFEEQWEDLRLRFEEVKNNEEVHEVQDEKVVSGTTKKRAKSTTHKKAS